MSVRKILTVPNPALRQKSHDVFFHGQKPDKKTQSLIADLKQTLKTQSDPKGVGLSAPQIDVLKKVLVLEINKKILTVINPKILFVSQESLTSVLPKEKKFLEGCLSVPGYWGFVDRPYRVEVLYCDQNGEKITQTFEGKESAYFLHEYDHLEGILFIDRILEQKGQIYQIQKNEKGEEELVEIELVK